MWLTTKAVTFDFKRFISPCYYLFPCRTTLPTVWGGANASGGIETILDYGPIAHGAALHF